MSSLNDGKQEIVSWIKEHFPEGSTVLDVGACDGKWAKLLTGYTIDAVEIFEPNIRVHNLKYKYRNVYNCNILDYKYDYYDLIIFGDVIEHMQVWEAQVVLDYAKERCKDIIVGVPFLYPQDEIYGNPYERHIQDDLTEVKFYERYKGFELLLKPRHNYAYYKKGESK